MRGKLRSLKVTFHHQIESVFLLLALSALGSYASCARENGFQTDSFLSDITDAVNLNFVHHPGVDGSYFMPEIMGSGGAFLDYDNDGDLDIYLVNGNEHRRPSSDQQQSANRLYRQDAGGTFSDVTEQSGLGDTGYGMGVGVGDIDNDGHVDVYLSNLGPDALYRSNGDGTFSDITKASGIDNPYWGVSVIFVDYNLDNFLDIFVTNYVQNDTSVHCTDRVGRRDYCGPQGFPGVADKLFQNNGDGTFRDVSLTSGIALQKSAGLGATSFDFNNDDYPDIYVANDREQNHLWVNRKDGTFEDQAVALGVGFNRYGMPEASMGIAVGDVDNDNDFDLFMTHFVDESNTLYRNSGELGFQDDTTPAGLSAASLPFTGFGTGFFDYDHDGDLDIAIVNGRVIRGPLLTKSQPIGYWDHYAEPNLIFENDGTGRFQNSSHLAFSFSGQIENSRGLAFGDVDNDGDIDLLVTNDGGRARLYRNDWNAQGNWLIVRAIDPILNRDAYGARVSVFVPGLSFTRLINAGYGFCSSHDPRAHFGLAGASAVEKIVVEWPGGQRESFFDIEPNQILTLKRGQGSSTQE